LTQVDQGTVGENQPHGKKNYCGSSLDFEIPIFVPLQGRNLDIQVVAYGATAL
jgi:hypothetical protein